MRTRASDRLAELHVRFADDLEELAAGTADNPELRACIYEQAALSRGLADDLLTKGEW